MATTGGSNREALAAQDWVSFVDAHMASHRQHTLLGNRHRGLQDVWTGKVPTRNSGKEGTMETPVARTTCVVHKLASIGASLEHSLDRGLRVCLKCGGVFILDAHLEKLKALEQERIDDED